MTCLDAATGRSSLTTSIVLDVFGLPGRNVFVAVAHNEAMLHAVVVHWISSGER